MRNLKTKEWRKFLDGDGEYSRIRESIRLYNLLIEDIRYLLFDSRDEGKLEVLDKCQQELQKSYNFLQMLKEKRLYELSSEFVEG